MYSTFGMFRGATASVPGPADVYSTLAARTFSVQAGGSTSRSLTLPSPISAGQLIVLVLTPSGGGVNTPVGYTKVSGQNVFYQVASGSEDGTTVNFTVSASGAVSLHSALVFSDAVSVEATSLGTSGSDPDPPALTVDWGADKNLFLTIVHPQGPGVDWQAYPTNCPLYRTTTEISSTEENIAGAESLLATFNPNTWDMTSGEYRVYTLGLH